MTLSENIKELRKQKNLRQEQLAEAMGVSTASVSKWETAQCAPELTVLIELADFFEVSVDTLVGHRLNAERMETLIEQLEKSVEAHEVENASSQCEKILRCYPNDEKAVEACASCYYRLFITTQKKEYMEQCIVETKRLMTLKKDESEKERLERTCYLGNQYALLNQWGTAKKYYEQSDVNGSNSTLIAECLLREGQTQKAVTMLSDVIVENVFQIFQAIHFLAEGWDVLGEKQKACSALKWIVDVMDLLHYNPTAMVITLMQMAELYHDLKQPEMVKDVLLQAAKLATENSSQEIHAEADFLQIEKAKKLLVSAPENNRAMLIDLAEKMGEPFTEIVNEALHS